jgi:hypothetical protein
MIRRLIAIPLVLLLLGMQEPRNPEDYVGPEDPAHQGQPKSCTNTSHRNAVKKDCACVKKSCDPNSTVMEDPKCYVYCRKPACRCDHGCETN